MEILIKIERLVDIYKFWVEVSFPFPFFPHQIFSYHLYKSGKTSFFHHNCLTIFCLQIIKNDYFLFSCLEKRKAIMMAKEKSVHSVQIIGETWGGRRGIETALLPIGKIVFAVNLIILL